MVEYGGEFLCVYIWGNFRAYIWGEFLCAFTRVWEFFVCEKHPKNSFRNSFQILSPQIPKNQGKMGTVRLSTI